MSSYWRGPQILHLLIFVAHLFMGLEFPVNIWAQNSLSIYGPRIPCQYGNRIPCKYMGLEFLVNIWAQNSLSIYRPRITCQYGHRRIPCKNRPKIPCQYMVLESLVDIGQEFLVDRVAQNSFCRGWAKNSLSIWAQNSMGFTLPSPLRRERLCAKIIS